MNLTHEQKDIISTVGHLNSHLAINAYAGTGKTTTLKAIAEAYPQYRFLYLAYNTSVRREAEKKFPSNVKVLTTHGLAYRWYVNAYGRKPDLTPFRAYDLTERYSISYRGASTILSALHWYCNSSDKSFAEILNKQIKKMVSKQRAQILSNKYYQPHIKEKKLFELEIEERKLYAAGPKFLNDLLKGFHPITHDFYLKLASESDTIKYVFEDYDFILLDEAQDTNPVVFKMLLKANKPIIAVGDSHQKIYGFRNSIDVMYVLEQNYNAEKRYLTHSFRFSQDIADVANEVIKIKSEAFNIDLPRIKGLGPKSVSYESAILTRTNADIVVVIYDRFKNNDKEFRTYRKPDEIFELPMAIYVQLINKKYNSSIRISDSIWKFISKFKQFGELKTYAEEAEDIELIRAVEAVEKLDNDLPKVYEFHIEVIKNRSEKLNILTAHTSKGLEFNSVYVKPWSDSVPYSKLDIDLLIEELNLAYVAATRPSKDLNVNDVIKLIVDIGYPLKEQMKELKEESNEEEKIQV